MVCQDWLINNPINSLDRRNVAPRASVRSLSIGRDLCKIATDIAVRQHCQITVYNRDIVVQFTLISNGFMR